MKVRIVLGCLLALACVVAVGCKRAVAPPTSTPTGTVPSPVVIKDGKPLFEFLDDESVTTLAENYASNPPVSVTVRYDTIEGGTPTTSTSAETIDTVYQALAAMVVGKSLGSGHTDDYLLYTFTLADGTRVSFEFQSGALLVRGMELYEISNFGVLYTALPPPGS